MNYPTQPLPQYADPKPPWRGPEFAAIPPTPYEVNLGFGLGLPFVQMATEGPDLYPNGGLPDSTWADVWSPFINRPPIVPPYPVYPGGQ